MYTLNTGRPRGSTLALLAWHMAVQGAAMYTSLLEMAHMDLHNTREPTPIFILTVSF